MPIEDFFPPLPAPSTPSLDSFFPPITPPPSFGGVQSGFSSTAPSLDSFFPPIQNVGDYAQPPTNPFEDYRAQMLAAGALPQEQIDTATPGLGFADVGKLALGNAGITGGIVADALVKGLLGPASLLTNEEAIPQAAIQYAQQQRGNVIGQASGGLEAFLGLTAGDIAGGALEEAATAGLAAPIGLAGRALSAAPDIARAVPDIAAALPSPAQVTPQTAPTGLLAFQPARLEARAASGSLPVPPSAAPIVEEAMPEVAAVTQAAVDPVSVLAEKRDPIRRFLAWVNSGFRAGPNIKGNDSYLAAQQYTGPAKSFVQDELPRLAEGLRENRDAFLLAADRQRREVARGIADYLGKDKGGFEDVAQAMNAARRSGDLSTLPGQLQDVSRRAGMFIDEWSQRFIDEGMLGEAEVENFRNNMGSYLNVSHDVFDFPNWRQRMEGGVAFENAFSYMKKTHPDWTDERALGEVYSILDRNPDAMQAWVPNGMKIDGSELKHRKDIAPEIRELMGVRKDFLVNFDRTAALMINDVEVNAFKRAARIEGTKAGVFYDSPTAQHSVPVKMDRVGGNQVVAYTLPETAALFDAVTDNAAKSGLMFLNGITKAFKTVGSVQTQGRNFASGLLFATMNGTLGHPLLMAKNTPKTFRLVNNLISNGKLFRELDAEVIEAARYGIVGQGAAREFSEWFGAAGRMMQPSGISKLIPGPLRHGFNQSFDLAKRAYRAGDEFWKFLTWKVRETELVSAVKTPEDLAAIARVYGTDDLKRIAADFAKDTVQHYGRTSPIAQTLARNPVVGTVGTTFAFEVPRNLLNSIKYAHKDWAVYKLTGNTDFAKSSVSKAAGSAAAVLAFTAAQQLGKQKHGVSDEQMAAMRELNPQYWEKNAETVITDVKDRFKVTYWSGGFMDPMNGMKQPIAAFYSREGDFGDKLANLITEIEDTYVGMELGFKTVLESLIGKRIGTAPITTSLSGRDPFAGQVRQEGDVYEKKVADTAYHLYRSLAPGTVVSAERVARGADILPSQKGYRHYDLNEELSALLGPRIVTIDLLNDGYRRHVVDFIAAKEAVGQARRNAMNTARTPEEYKQALDRADEAWRGTLETIQARTKDIQTWGATRRDLAKILLPASGEGRSVGDKVFSAVLSNEFVSYNRLYPPDPWRPPANLGQ